jgi:hypothetical protein
MKFLSKIIGVFLVVFAVVFYQAEPAQRHHPGPHKNHYRGHHRPKFKRAVYHRPAPRHYYKKHYYRPVRHRYHPHKRYKNHRIYRSRPVIIIHR